MENLRIVKSQGLMDINEASEYLAMKKSTLYQRCMKKEIRYIKLGKLNRFRKQDLDKYIDDNIVEVGGFD